MKHFPKQRKYDLLPHHFEGTKKILKVSLYKYSISDAYEDLFTIKPGDFVTFKGTLQKNPLISVLESITQIMEMTLLFSDNNSMHNSGKSKGKNKSNNDKIILKQIKGLIEGLKTGGIIDIICKIEGNQNLTAVLQTYNNYFYNKNMSEIIDGEFKVLGKVTKIINENDSINLLRNTSLSLMKQSFMQQVITVLQSDIR